MKVIHPFGPIYNEKSNILILGSFPSVKSRENNFYYGHPQNRFWKVLESIFNEKIENTIEGKKLFLYSHNIALWDTVKSCDIVSSSDSTIKNSVLNDINSLINNTNIKTIFCNGNTSYNLLQKHFDNIYNIPIIPLPSTSPANAKFSLDDLIKKWEIINKKR